MLMKLIQVMNENYLKLRYILRLFHTFPTVSLYMEKEKQQWIHTLHDSLLINSFFW